MKIMVTGGAGFLGSNLIKRLLNEGHEVYCVDNLSTGRLLNLESFFFHPNFHYSRADILDDNLPLCASLDRFGESSFLGDVKFDQIYHLASPASPPKYQIDPIKTFRINTEGTHKILEFARRCDARVLYASTSETYGDPLEHPQNEEYRGNVNTIGPRACYDEGKRGGETICSDHYRMHGTKVLIARIFNTYGPNMDPNDGRVVSNMICQLIKGEDITIYGDGYQTRSFTYVDDLIDGFIRLMNSNLFCMPINLGNPNEFTIKQLGNALIHEFEWSHKPTFHFKPLPIDDPRQRKPDISRAKMLLDWEPQIQLHEGLKLTVQYFMDQLSHESVIT